jgi:two-component system sensor histidine kinase and response regulator WspE
VSDDLSGFSLMELFRMEAEQHTATLSAGLVALEGGSAAPESIEPLMRAAHSLKGAARIVGLDAAVQVAHAMEDAFVAAQKGQLVLRPEHVDILLRGVDFLVQIAQLGEDELPAWQAEHAAEVDALVADLTAVKEGRAEAAPRADTPPAEPPAAGATAAEAGPPGSGAGPQGRLDPSRPDVDAPGSDSSPRGMATEGSGPPSGPGWLGSKPAPAGEPPGEGPSAPAPAPLPAPPSEPAERDRERDHDRVVRVTAESLTRLMGLAGEALVQSHRLRPIVDVLWRLRERQTQLLESLQVLEDRLSGTDGGRGPAGLGGAAGRELLSRTRGRAVENSQALAEAIESLESFTHDSEDLSSRLHHEVLASRMRPLADGIRGFPRLVRDLARELGKEAKFEVVGETTGVDRDILDRLEAPLNHLIRNALDHGLESPEERRAAGKPAAGTIRLEARHRAGMLQLVLSDDGRGIDAERLRAKVLERGLADPAMARRLGEAELLDFLFLPGFSTKEQVTAVSGRGVGLDVVHSMVHAVRGSVRIANRPGKGTRFILQLPITVSVIRALLVEIADEPYAFPLSRIDRIVMVAPGDVRDLEGKPHVLLDDHLVGLVEATRVLEVEPAAEGGHGQGRRAGDALPVVVASDRSHRFGVVVDRFLGERDLRVSPLDARLGKVPNISSSSVLEDDWPVLIVDVEDLIRSVDNLLSGRRLGKLAAEAESAGTKARALRRVLVVDDSITVRELERQLLEGRGYVVDTAVDGVDGWNAVRSGRYDLVVSDIDMPRMDGIQLVRHIKEDARLQAIPVVVVSYKDREEDRIKGLDAGANAYLTKSSFHDQTFLTTVADLIGEARE